MEIFNFSPLDIPTHIPELRRSVREFLGVELSHLSPLERSRSWMGFDDEFSRKLGARGWIGMAWPKQYGGQEQTAIERYVVIEELLSVGAPVGAHWIADRQSGPQILRFGTEAARQAYLRPITKGELYFCIGMSEPNAGSDLAAIKTHADKVDGGWRINGNKLWTTNADKAHIMIALVRTTKNDDNRHAGLSQFLIDLYSNGITRNTITDHVGDTHFGEVFFDDVFVKDDMLLGNEGEGWPQVNAELSLERSGPERYLSSYRIYEEFKKTHNEDSSDCDIEFIGNTAAQLWTLRQMSLSIAGQLTQGRNPVLESAIVKDLGACFEQGLPIGVQGLLDRSTQPACNAELDSVLNYLLKTSPAFSIRRGARKILRGIISREIGLR